MSQDVSLDRVTMRFGDVTAVDDVSLTIRAGEFFSFLGPSGCGKTTLLRIISGFAEPTSGMVRIGERDMAGIGPNARPTALIFQNLALFPLMSVWENIAFGLEVRGVPKAVRRKRAEELLALVAMPDAADRRVAELSGGMKQRVAIARALAVEPEVMLLDEPLSALDLKLRQHMRAELRAIQRRTGVTFIYITHDQGEALTMSDRIAVMSRGRIEQVGTPAEVYERPRTPFVAGFVGEINAFPGRVVAREGATAEVETAVGRLAGEADEDIAVGSPATVYIRPECLALDTGVRATLPVTVAAVDFEGSFALIGVTDSTGTRRVVQLANDGRRPIPVPGEALTVGFDPRRAIVLPGGAAP